MPTIETLKSQAKLLRNHFAKENNPLSHSQALEAIAAAHGFRDWNTASAASGTSAIMTKTISPELYVELENKAKSLQDAASDKHVLFTGVSDTSVMETLSPEMGQAILANASGRVMMVEPLEPGALEEPIRADLLQKLGVIEQIGPPGLICSAKGMLAALQQQRLAEPLAGKVGAYLFSLPGFRYGRHDDAEALHAKLLAQRQSAQ
jgi:hypothetical protein